VTEASLMALTIQCQQFLQTHWARQLVISKIIWMQVLRFLNLVSCSISFYYKN